MDEVSGLSNSDVSYGGGRFQPMGYPEYSDGFGRAIAAQSGHTQESDIDSEVEAPDKSVPNFPDKDCAGHDWTFTINNPNANDLARLKLIFQGEEPQVRYMIYQLEKGKKTGTLHYQGFMVLNESRKFSWVKNHINERAHWKRSSKNKRQRNITYCSKLDTKVEGPWIYGSPIGLLKNDPQAAWKDIYEMALKGKTEMEICKLYPSQYIRCSSGIRRLIFLGSTAPRDWKTTVVVYYGITGSGKSRRAAAEATPAAYWKPHGQWWDGYYGQENVVIDDYYGDIPYRIFLNLLDRYPLILETKGGSVTCRIKTLWITSNKHPRNWYQAQYEYSPIERRIDRLVEFKRRDLSVFDAFRPVVVSESDLEFFTVTEKG